MKTKETTIKYSNKTDQIHRSKWETQFYQNGNIRFGLFQFESHKNAECEQEMMSLEERIDRDREFKHVLNKQKLRFSRKSALSINGFCNSEQLDSIFLEYAYQLVKSVLSHSKYEITCRITLQV